MVSFDSHLSITAIASRDGSWPLVKRRFDDTTKRGENYAKRAQDNTAGAKRASRARGAMEREQRGSTQRGTQRELYLSCSGPARVIMSIHVGTDSA
jgi:hypothetical protein